MGQCQSRNVAAEQYRQQRQHHQVTDVEKGTKPTTTTTTSTSVFSNSPLRLFRIRHHDKAGETSPATPGTTKTISPSDNTESTLDSSDLSESDHGLNLLSVLASPSNQKLATFPEEEEEEEEDEETEEDDFDSDHGVPHSNHYDFGVGTPSLLFQDDFESAIPEEEDPDAPSDEEDFHGTPKWKDRAGPLVSSSLAGRLGRSGGSSGGGGSSGSNNSNLAPLTTSPPRTQASVKLRKGRVTNPQSIVHRPEPTPLVAPNEVQNSIEISRNAVKPHTLAEFNRLKVQVKLANRHEKVKHRASKLEDRYEDVRGYKSLWNEYEKIERKLSEDGMGSESGTPSTSEGGHRLKRSTSFDLKDADTWFFDFQSIDGSEEEEDNESQCHLSLLSESSMEAQRLLFAEKSAERYRKAELAKQERRKQRRQSKKDAEGRGEECDEEEEEKKAEETPRSQVAASQVLTTPRDLFRSKTGDDDSQASAASRASSYSQHSHHLRSSGRDYGPARNYLQESPITDMEVSFSGHRLVRTDSDFDDNTSQLSVDIDDSHDYHVPRRRRRHRNNHGDDESFASGITSNISYDEERMELASASDGDMYGLDSLSIHSNEAAVEAELNAPVTAATAAAAATTTRESPPKPAFGAPYLERPEPRWREFSNVKEQVLMNNAAKCLRDVYSTKALLSAEAENDDGAVAEDEEKLIQIMTTDEFLRMSEGLAAPVPPPRLSLHTEKVEMRQNSGSEYRILTKAGDYGPAREYSPKKGASPNSKGSPSKSSVGSSSEDGVRNQVLSRIHDADNKGSGDDYTYRYESKSPMKRSPVKDNTPHDEPGAIIMGKKGQRVDVYNLRSVMSASSTDSPVERYMV